MTVDEIKQLVHDTVDTNDDTFPDDRMVRSINYGIDKAVNVILDNDPNTTPWDDDNYTDLPVGYLDVVSGQTWYDLKEDENFANVLYIHSVYAKDDNGTYRPLDLLSMHDIRSEDSMREDEDGSPRYYRQIGFSIAPFPKPNYNASKGLKIFFQRVPDKITTSDTTKEIGISTTFHYLIALYAGYLYARAKRLDNKNDILREIEQEEIKLGLRAAGQDIATDTFMSSAPDENI